MLEDCKLIDLPKISDPRGNLTFIESNQHIPFDIKRVYYTYDVPGGSDRGAHAHKQLQQLIIAMSGSFDVVLDDGFEKKRFHLNRSYFGLYVCRMILEAAESGCESAREVCINLVSSKSISVREVIETVIRLTGAKVGIEQLGHERGRSTEFDNRRMLERFGAERVCFQEGLAEEINSLRGSRSPAR